MAIGNASWKAFQDSAGIYNLAASGQFEGAYNTIVSADAMAKLNLLCPNVEVQSSVYRFAGIKSLPRMRPFNGEMKYAGVDQWTVTAYQQEYGIGVSIRYLDYRNDVLNMNKYMTNVPAYLAQEAIKHRFELMAAIAEGNPTWEPDGKAIYADDHDFGDNNLSVTVSSATNPTTSDWQTVIDALVGRFGTFTGDQGENLVEDVQAGNFLMLAPAKYAASLNRISNELVVPRVFGSNTAAAPVDNINIKTFTSLCSPRLTAANNVVYVVLGNESAELIGSAAGSGPAFASSTFIPWEFTTNAGGQSDTFRRERRIESEIYGAEGVTCIAAQRTIKVTLA